MRRVANVFDNADLRPCIEFYIDSLTTLKLFSDPKGSAHRSVGNTE